MAAKTPKVLSFEAALAELEKVVADMETGKLTLEDSLIAYKRGAELLQICRGRLQDVQQQVQVLEEGVLKNFVDPLAQDAAPADHSESNKPKRDNFGRDDG